MFDGVISDGSSLHSATLCSREEFQYILERAGAYATVSGDMPLFRDDESRTSDPGNRCKLRLRHALLMSLMRKKDNPTQGTLQAIFGVDQTSACRYLKVMDKILAAVLPTARNVSEEITSCETREEFKRIVPGPDGGDIIADGTHCPVRRPPEKTVRRMIYSGKKKWFTYNTAVYANVGGIIIGILRCLWVDFLQPHSGCHDTVALRDSHHLAIGRVLRLKHDAGDCHGSRRVHRHATQTGLGNVRVAKLLDCSQYCI